MCSFTVSLSKHALKPFLKITFISTKGKNKEGEMIDDEQSFYVLISLPKYLQWSRTAPG